MIFHSITNHLGVFLDGPHGQDQNIQVAPLVGPPPPPPPLNSTFAASARAKLVECLGL